MVDPMSGDPDPVQPLLCAVRVVLVETSHPGNIGAAARAMKSMGMNGLWLVRPKRFPCAEATARAAGADDLLESATVCDRLEEAIAQCGWVVAASARARRIAWPEIDAREWATRAIEHAAHGEVALLFGRESWGLTNRELDCCHAMVTIPTDPGFRSLNLAAAVQVLAYELRSQALAVSRVAVQARDRAHGHADSLAPAAELEGLYAHLERTLLEVGYLDREAPKLLMRRLRRLFNRAGVQRSELNILRGVLSAVLEATRRD